MQQKKNALLVLCFFCSISFFIYSTNFQGPFVYDDLWQIVDSTFIQNKDLQKIASQNKRIVTNYSFYLNSIAGTNLKNKNLITTLGGPDTITWHFTNIALHTFCSFFFFLLLRQSFPRMPQAFAILFSLIFLLHPLNSEPVNYIQARAVILMVGFILVAMIFWQNNHQGLSLFFIVFAVLSKEVAIFYIFAFVVIFNFYHNKLFTSRNRKSIIVIMILFIFSLFILYSAIEQRYQSGNFWTNLFLQLIAYWHYVFLYLFPFASNLSFDHYYLNTFPNTMPVICSIAMFFVIFFVVKNHKSIFYIFISSIIIVTPYIMIPTSFTLVEYRAYPLTAIFTFLLALILEKNKQVFIKLTTIKTNKISITFVLLIIFVFLGYQTRERSRVWRTASELYFDAIKKGSLRSGIHVNLAISYVVTGQVVWGHDKKLALSYFELGKNKIHEILDNYSLSREQSLMLNMQLLKIYEAYGDNTALLKLIFILKSEIQEIKVNDLNLILLLESNAFYNINKLDKAKEILHSIERNDLSAELEQLFAQLHKKIYKKP